MNVIKLNKLIKTNIDMIWNDLDKLDQFNVSEIDHTVSTKFINLKLNNLIDGKNYYHDGGYYTERISFDLQNRSINFEVVEGRTGPIMFVKGRITLSQILPHITEIQLDMTYNQIFGLFGPLFEFVLEHPSLFDLKSDILMEREVIEQTSDSLSNNIEIEAVVSC